MIKASASNRASTNDVVLDGDCVVAFRQLTAVRVDKQGEVSKLRLVPAKGLVELQMLVNARQPLLCRRKLSVLSRSETQKEDIRKPDLASQDMSDAHLMIIDHVGQVVCGEAV
jgi:hypothetical protein